MQSIRSWRSETGPERATCIARCGLDGETVVENLRDLPNKKLPYLSMIIIKKQGKGY